MREVRKSDTAAYSARCTPKTSPEKETIRISMMSRIMPKLTCGRRRWIMAEARSVPPVVALPMSTSARPTPRMPPPRIVASSRSSVMANMGKASRNRESTIIATSERAANVRPICFQERRNRGTLITADIRPTGRPHRW